MRSISTTLSAGTRVHMATALRASPNSRASFAIAPRSDLNAAIPIKSVMQRTLRDIERTGKGNLLSATEPVSGHAGGMELHDKIRAARTAAGLSQREVARLLGVSNSAVAQWELGETKPTYSNLIALAAVAHVDTASLIGQGATGNSEDTELSVLISHWQKIPVERRPLVLRMIMTAIDAEGPVRPTPGAPTTGARKKEPAA